MPHIQQEQAEKQGLPIKLIPTGRTFQEIAEELKQGLPQLQSRSCYLCHRREGDPGVCLIGDGKDISYTRITLDSYDIEYLGTIKAKFYLCLECYILLTNLGTLDSESEE